MFPFPDRKTKNVLKVVVNVNGHFSLGLAKMEHVIMSCVTAAL